MVDLCFKMANGEFRDANPDEIQEISSLSVVEGVFLRLSDQQPVQLTELDIANLVQQWTYESEDESGGSDPVLITLDESGSYYVDREEFLRIFSESV